MTGEWERTLVGQLVEAGLGRAEADGLARDAAEEARDASRDPQELYGPAVAYASTLVRALHVAETGVLGASRGGGEVVLRLQSVSKSYGRREIFRGIDLELRAGEIAAVVGANGSGKSTLLGICAGLIRPSSGVVQRVPRIGYAPQLGGVAPLLTPDEHFRLFGAAHPHEGPESPGDGTQARVPAWLATASRHRGLAPVGWHLAETQRGAGRAGRPRSPPAR